ncbi:hypothetical protein MMC10_010180 [Thelotrema lepadinum]|nr:hypothetical protein [Thelotrema lepadinum]
MAWTARIKNHLARESGAHKRGSDTNDRRLTKRAMHSGNMEGSEPESGGTASHDDNLSNPVDHRRQSSPTLTTNNFRTMQAQINRSVAEHRHYHPRPKARELWDGQEVKIYSNGTVSLWVPLRGNPLRWYISPEAQPRIEKVTGSTTIHFFLEEIVLKIGDEIVFSRSKTFMENAQGGEDWKQRVEKELRAKRCSTLLSESKELSSFTDASGGPETCRSRSAGPNADRRKRLLEGSDFHCGEVKNQKSVKVTLRGPFSISIPRHADFSRVWVQCDLLKKGDTHPRACAKQTSDTDPAKRLGICFKYRSKKNRQTEE